tara:strand:- start:207 stop:386 length:180 start_codon:yes stop_codon:yes gene_type:complete
MELTKGYNKKPKQYPIQVNEKLHEKIRHLAYQNKVSQKEIIKRAVALYEKASIFDNLIK